MTDEFKDSLKFKLLTDVCDAPSWQYKVIDPIIFSAECAFDGLLDPGRLSIASVSELF